MPLYRARSAALPSAVSLAIISALLFAAEVRAYEPAGDTVTAYEAEAAEAADTGTRQGLFPRVAGQAVMLDINARIMERDRVVSWNESRQKITVPGHPVEVKLVGANVVVAVQFTPYVRRGGTHKFLVAQGRVWMETPGRGVRYHASMQTMPVRFGEPVYFFPLGPVRDDSPSIEVVLTIHPYEQ